MASHVPETHTHCTPLGAEPKQGLQDYHTPHLHPAMGMVKDVPNSPTSWLVYPSECQQDPVTPLIKYGEG